MVNSNLFVIIQARMGSTRLHGKVLLPLCGKTVLEMMFERLKPFADNIIVATTDDGSEEPIVKLCERLGVRYHRGDTDDVLSRYYEAGVKYGAEDSDTIVRLTSDCPLIDPTLVQQVIDRFRQSGCDYASNVGKRTYPRGMDTEVFSFAALQKAFFQAREPFEREHVTPYIRDTHKSEFHIERVKDSRDNSKYRLTLDEFDDYKAIQKVYNHFGCSADFTYEQLLDALYEKQEIHALNAHVEQKKA